MLDTTWQQGSLMMLHRLGPYEKRHTGENRQHLEKPRGYIEPRLSITDCPSFRQQGCDCGSGPTESQCGTLTARIKGAGMRWDSDTALDHSKLWKEYWKLQQAA
jgi:hypothetical protein